jgi:hypothetical protein
MTGATEARNRAAKMMIQKEAKYLSFNMAEEDYGLGSAEYKNSDTEDATSFGQRPDTEYI